MNDGVWPSWAERLWRQDLRRGRHAPSRDGLAAPTFETPAWLERDASDEVVATARDMRDAAVERVASTEKRAASVFDVAWKLLALALAVTGFEAARLRAAGVPLVCWLVLLPNGAALVSLALASLQGVTTSHRVGMHWGLEIERIARAPNPNTARAIDYWHAARTSNWTASRKLDDFLTAQAWLSRGSCRSCSARS